MPTKDELENNRIDLIASAAKSVLGNVPFVGSLLSELVNNLIPNQRIDRLSKFVKELEIRISEIPSEKLNTLLGNEEFIDLVEEGFFQASRSITDERRQYIASIIANGILDEDIELNESKYLLKLLQDLNDVEIIWLRYYFVPTVQGDEVFREKHERILMPFRVNNSTDHKSLTKASLQHSYKEHLERLGLIEHKDKIDRSKGIPEYDIASGKPKKSHPTISNLGRLLLKQIGVINSI